MTEIHFISAPVSARAVASSAARLAGLAILAGVVWYGTQGLWSLAQQVAHTAQDLLQGAWSVMSATAGLGAPR